MVGGVYGNGAEGGASRGGLTRLRGRQLAGAVHGVRWMESEHRRDVMSRRGDEVREVTSVSRCHATIAPKEAVDARSVSSAEGERGVGGGNVGYGQQATRWSCMLGSVRWPLS